MCPDCTEKLMLLVIVQDAQYVTDCNATEHQSSSAGGRGEKNNSSSLHLLSLNGVYLYCMQFALYLK